MNTDRSSDGQYRAEHWEGQNEFVVIGPGWETVGGTYTKNEADIGARFANLAYAEGRKAAEKEIEELLNWANWFEEFYRAGCEEYRYEPTESIKFNAWKKARGIN